MSLRGQCLLQIRHRNRVGFSDGISLSSFPHSGQATVPQLE